MTESRTSAILPPFVRIYAAITAVFTVAYCLSALLAGPERTVADLAYAAGFAVGYLIGTALASALFAVVPAAAIWGAICLVRSLRRRIGG